MLSRKKLRNTTGLSFGNDIYRISFDQKSSYRAFGCRYVFKLEELSMMCRNTWSTSQLSCGESDFSYACAITKPRSSIQVGS
ncbi:hypothetical protein M427DRAFT_388399 [Gonapodya prolifera JEL478]|uniref:mRNA cap guanine-N(7) methyltransferase n=1 Tax=Gonapodya prolifera (strain JEL478) TaxID=1344416 RepID=A0A139A8I4_GONPJ|nr:hypothetical protein M427DRAFT_388399 [Gonapodya prolifera JEL478]|eukprot:KXS13009.1 hypothetical protein M427DRAFT_388399 [Gonapodya prolifera JEL478]